MDEHKPIDPAFAFILVVTAFLIDGLQFLLTILIVGIVMNPIIDVIATMIFGIMLSHHSPSLLSRRVVSLMATSILEFFPFLGAFPAWTAFAVSVIVMDKFDQARPGHGEKSSRNVPSKPRASGKPWRL